MTGGHRKQCYVPQVLGIDSLAKALERVADIALRMQLPVKTLVLDVRNVCVTHTKHHQCHGLSERI